MKKGYIMLEERIKALRKSYNLNQPQLAEILNVTKQTVSNWENGNILPSIEMLLLLANHFKVSTDYLLGLDDRNYIEITQLSMEEVSHIQQLVNDIRKGRPVCKYRNSIKA